MKAFKSRLRELVAKKYGYMTHEQIAEAAGITRRVTVTRWMSDKPLLQLNMKVLEPLADFLECRVEDLYEVVDVDDPLNMTPPPSP